ncbi:hypothetical protein [Roseibium sp.]|uniref:hypothetical protein n=1 Tax=Roseibium sp. TaxID=1936156 RepID=UPI003BAD1B4D
MANAFDTLSYARDLEKAGVPRNQAAAHADAARTYVMADLVTKEDLRLALESHENKMTMRIGSMLAAVVGFYVLLEKLWT